MLQKGSKESCSKKALLDIYEELTTKKSSLKQLYDSLSQDFFSQKTDGEQLSSDQIVSLDTFRQKISNLQKEITTLEQKWKQVASEKEEEEFEGLWHQPDTTIGQLIIDYTDGDCIYVMPPDIAGLKIHLSSKLSIPKLAWGELLEVILNNAGIGIKPLNNFVKQLYLLKQNPGGLRYISDDRTILDTLPGEQKIAFVCSPPVGELRRVSQFLEKFAPQEQLFVQIIGGNLVLIGQVREVKDLMKVYDFVAAPKRSTEYRIVTLHRGDSEEVAKILSCLFDSEGAKISDTKNVQNQRFLPQAPNALHDTSYGFRVIPLKYPASSLFFMGRHDQIEKACQIVADVEKSIGEVQQRNIHWYACKHSDAEDLAKVLSQVYSKMMNLPNVNLNGKADTSQTVKVNLNEKVETTVFPRANLQDSLLVEPPPMVSIDKPKADETTAISENFVIDPKTNSIIMVVENSVYPALKELLHKLDIPKRMVQIDVLLFEKKVMDSSSMGLNRLKMADAASKKRKNGLAWYDPIFGRSYDDDVKYDRTSNRHYKGHHHHHHKKNKDGVKGILEFFYSRPRQGWFPAYDLAYQFLLTQEDVQINANPSVTTVNQTPARISVVEQISINTGAVEFDHDHFKEAYTRAEYGITIQITPTIHAKMDDEESDEPKFVTLATDIIFDTPQSDHHDRPDITRRNIKNEVRVQDGETVILGGLRRKHSGGKQQMIPFLGEIPGIGKLFSMTELGDTNTEMFIFLTPRILPDDHEKFKAIRLQELMKRPGDTPEFLHEVIEAKKAKKEHLMEKSIKMVLGRPDTSL